MPRIRCLTLLLPLLGGFSPLAFSFQAKLPEHGSQQSHVCADQRLQMAANKAVTETTKSGTKNVNKEDKSKKAYGGIVGNWEELHGNWVLRPASSETPRALLHFLGGALVGAAPHITYRYMLERLAEKGFLVVATPYQLSFDHLEICDDVISKFEKLAPSIARQYGAVPVVGIGHSCGALLHVLITSLFPDTPRAANALISYNNKPITEAVPFFEEVFAPFFTAIASTNGTLPSSNDALTLALSLAKAATEGK
jgi:acetyl esterase/lipase